MLQGDGEDDLTANEIYVSRYGPESKRTLMNSPFIVMQKGESLTAQCKRRRSEATPVAGDVEASVSAQRPAVSTLAAASQRIDSDENKANVRDSSPVHCCHISSAPFIRGTIDCVLG